MDTIGDVPLEMLPLYDLIVGARVVVGGVNQGSGSILLQINLAAEEDGCTQNLGDALDTLSDTLSSAEGH
jgi:hypothetical protein